ncbi:DUF4136 domain-containing protein [Kaarinaea lacus]
MQFRVTHKINPNYDFSKIQSYELVKNKQDKIENLQVDEAWLSQSITSSIRNTLSSKGLTENPEQAQIIVSYYVVVEMTLDTVVIDNYYSNYYQYSAYPTSAMPAHRKIAYNKGTLVIDVIDKKHKQFVWRGAADTVVREKTEKEQREKNIRKAVDQIFKQFPR